MKRKCSGTFSLRIAFTVWFMTLSVVGLTLVVSETPAESNRHHEAHEHGTAKLNVAVEGNNLYIEFSSPAANVVGFEHLPRTQKQKAAVADAKKKLKEGLTLFHLPAGSMSRLVDVSVKTDIDSHSDHHEKAGHNGEEDHHLSEKEKHKHEHHEADKDERHSDFEATYHFVCKKPEKLTHIDVKLINTFPGIEHIEVQLLAGTKQTAMELTAKKNTIRF